MNRLVGLSTTILRTMKNRTPGAIEFSFKVTMDLAEFDSAQFSREFIEAINRIELQEMKGWAACEKYLLTQLHSGEPIVIEEKKYFLVDEELMNISSGAFNGHTSQTQETDIDTSSDSDLRENNQD